MGRIAILHYTAAPAIGGIEQLIEVQRAALLNLGCGVRLIVGEADEPPGGELVRLPELHPSHPQIRCARSDLRGTVPPPDHPLVEATCKRIQDALQGCTQCWVHNAFTVYLNPFLTLALLRLTQEMPQIGWIAWCSDLSAVSAYWPSLTHGERERLCLVQPGVTYVTLSHARRRQLSPLLGLDEEEIQVIPPPLDPYDWLDTGAETRHIAERLELQTAQPIILVPAKLLEHKNLELAVRVAAALRRRVPRRRSRLGCPSGLPQPAVLLTGAASPHDHRASDSVRQKLRRLTRELGAMEALHLLPDLIGKVPEWKTIRDLMLLSDLLLLPSTEEGFGTPLREAAALRTPVLCSDIPPFREVAGAYARYFSLNASPESIARQAARIAALPVNQKRREAIQSYWHFRLQLQHLVHRVAQRPPVRHCPEIGTQPASQQ